MMPQMKRGAFSFLFLLLVGELAQWTSAQNCEHIWENLPGTKIDWGAIQIEVLSEFEPQMTEDRCKDDCESTTECRYIMYRHDNHTCWYTDDPDPPRSNNVQYNTWRLVRENCAEEQGVTYSTREFHGKRVDGLAYHSTTVDLGDCVTKCSLDATCFEVDFDHRDKKCFFGTFHDANLILDSHVTHVYVLKNNQPCPNSAQMKHKRFGFYFYKELVESNLHEIGNPYDFEFEECAHLCEVDKRCSRMTYNDITKKCYHSYCTRSEPVLHTNYVMRAVLYASMCSDEWVDKPEPDKWQCCRHYYFQGLHVDGLTDVGIKNTIDECVQSCVQDTTCQSVDYDSGDKHCYHGNFYTKNLKVKNHVTHVVINRCTGGCKCDVRARKYAGFQVDDLEQQGGSNQYTEKQCVDLCRMDPTCTQVDYDASNGKCYHGWCQWWKAGMKPNSAVNHYYLDNPCILPSRSNS